MPIEKTLRESSERISRDELGLRLAETYALRSTCLRAEVGAILTIEHRPIAAGYVGAPSGQPDCFSAGCIIGTHGGCTRTVHAEVNAIAFAAKDGRSTRGATLYGTHSPCIDCAKLIINSGVQRVVYRTPYRDRRGIELLIVSGVEVFNYSTPSEQTEDDSTGQRGRGPEPWEHLITQDFDE